MQNEKPGPLEAGGAAGALPGQLSRAEKVRALGEGGPAQQGEGEALASLAAAAVLVSGSKFSWDRARAEPGER